LPNLRHTPDIFRYIPERWLFNRGCGRFRFRFWRCGSLQSRQIEWIIRVKQGFQIILHFDLCGNLNDLRLCRFCNDRFGNVSDCLNQHWLSFHWRLGLDRLCCDRLCDDRFYNDRF
jgi:hypothetical protein